MKLSRRAGVVAGIVFVVLVALAAAYFVFAGGSSVRQPILFSHRVHAEEKQIACVYCHQGVQRSAVAGLPSVEKCMGCHRSIAADKPEVQKVAAAWENRENIAWARLVYVPDHVYFTHQQHIRAGIECRTCHGAINATTGSFSRMEPGMGWCLDCHRRNGASTDCWTCHK